MKITSKEILDTLDIKIGDEIIVNENRYKLIIDYKGNYVFVDKDSFKLLVEDLIDLEFEHIKSKKKIGETLCDDYENCDKCPLYLLRCDGYDGKDMKWPLYRVLNEICYKAGMKSNNPIYKAFRAELDKEVE